MWGMTEPGCSDPQLAGYGKTAEPQIRWKIRDIHFVTEKIPGELKNSQGIFSAVWISCPLDSVLRLALFFAAAVAS